MTDFSETTPTPDQTPTPKKSRRGALIALVTGAALVTGGVFGAQAIAQSKTFQHARMEIMGDGMGHFGGGWRHGEHKPFAEMTDEEVEKRVTRMVRHMAIELDATTEQEGRIVAIATSAVKELRPLRQEMQATRQQLRDILTADQVDRQALEQLRAARLADADRISKTLTNAVADVAEILTPAQRSQLQEMMERRRGRHGHGMMDNG